MFNIKIILLWTVLLQRMANAQSELACAGVPAGQFVRNSNSCQSYYFCDGHTSIAAKCPANYLFNAKTQMCDSPPNVNCNECSALGIQHLPDPSSCTGYLQCVNGEQSQVTCAGNLEFDAKMGDCNVASSSSSSCTTQSICSQFNEHMRIGDSEDCSL